MTKVCGYCKDTHGRHRLGCPYLKQNEEIAKWRSKHGYTPEMPLRIDGAHLPEECGKIPVGHEYNGVRGPADIQNPKDVAGSKKPPLDLIPKVALEEEAWVMDTGGQKYGYWNWRDIPIQLRSYVAAIMRHVTAIGDGEWLDPESGRPHAAHIRATAGIMLDAEAHGTLNHGR